MIAKRAYFRLATRGRFLVEFARFSVKPTKRAYGSHSVTQKESRVTLDRNRIALVLSLTITIVT